MDVLMTSKRTKNHQIFRRMNFLAIPLKKNLKIPGNSIGKIQETQENIHGESTKEFLSYHDAPFPSPPIPSMDLQDATKGRGNQRRRRLHRTPLNIAEVDFQMPNICIENIYIENISTFCGNNSEDEEKHLFRLKNT
jgi:hypothetical protein